MAYERLQQQRAGSSSAMSNSSQIMWAETSFLMMSSSLCDHFMIADNDFHRPKALNQSVGAARLAAHSARRTAIGWLRWTCGRNPSAEAWGRREHFNTTTPF
jgi:hypothetical protein